MHAHLPVSEHKHYHLIYLSTKYQKKNTITDTLAYLLNIYIQVVVILDGRITARDAIRSMATVGEFLGGF